jgi:TRAP-type C4-dicarboxylate transport system substrate-binding protein
VTSVIAMNSKLFDSFREEDKKVLLDSAKDVSMLSRKVSREGRKGEVTKIEKAGITIILPDRNDLRKSLDNIFQNPPTSIDKDLLELVKAVCRHPPFCR